MVCVISILLKGAAWIQFFIAPRWTNAVLIFICITNPHNESTRETHILSSRIRAMVSHWSRTKKCMSWTEPNEMRATVSCWITQGPEWQELAFIVSQVTVKEDAEQNQTQYWSYGYTSSYSPPTRPCSADRCLLGPAVQMVFSPPCCSSSPYFINFIFLLYMQRSEIGCPVWSAAVCERCCLWLCPSDLRCLPMLQTSG